MSKRTTKKVAKKTATKKKVATKKKTSRTKTRAAEKRPAKKMSRRMKRKTARAKQTTAEKPPQVPNKKALTLAQRSADGLAKAVGSWEFLIGSIVVIAIWVTLNVIGWAMEWDQYPFILLNLTLSCVSALQAPIILMSQNRQADRDRLMARYDYIVDRQAEREIREIQEDLREIKTMLHKMKK